MSNKLTIFKEKGLTPHNDLVVVQLALTLKFVFASSNLNFSLSSGMKLLFYKQSSAELRTTARDSNWTPFTVVRPVLANRQNVLHLFNLDVCHIMFGW